MDLVKKKKTKDVNIPLTIFLSVVLLLGIVGVIYFIFKIK